MNGLPWKATGDTYTQAELLTGLPKTAARSPASPLHRLARKDFTAVAVGGNRNNGKAWRRTRHAVAGSSPGAPQCPP